MNKDAKLNPSVTKNATQNAMKVPRISPYEQASDTQGSLRSL